MRLLGREALLAFIIPIVQRYRTIEFTRMITTTGAQTISLKASRSDLIGPDSRVTAVATGAMIQAITVQ